MLVHAMQGDLRVEAPFPVEQAVIVDGEALRVAFDWPVVRYLSGRDHPDADAVREALAERRRDVERTVAAHLFAHGFPLSGRLSLTLADFGVAAA